MTLIYKYKYIKILELKLRRGLLRSNINVSHAIMK